MQKAYLLASAITKVVGLTFDDLEWGSCINCTSDEFKNLRDLIKKPEFLSKYKGIEGYQKFADDHADKSMLKAYLLASAITKVVGLKFADLEWGSAILCTTEKFEALRKVIKAPGFLSEYKGIEGYQKFADEHADKLMQKAYTLVSAITKVVGLTFADLEWGSAFMGTTKEFEKFRDLIKAPGFLDKYKGIEGYQKFADEHADKLMQKAYTLVSAITKVVGLTFADLEWGSCINCTSDEFKNLRDLIKKPEFLSKYKGIEGYQKFADDHADKSMLKAYQLASAITKVVGLKFDDLEWGSCINCTSDEFKNLRDLIKKPEFLSKYKGIEGYQKFADDHADKSMQKAYLLASAITKVVGLKFDDLEWGSQIHCTTDKFKNLRDLIKEPGFLSEYKGIEGYQKFADEHADKSMQKAYMLVSAITKVVGLKFDKLKWGSQFQGNTKEYKLIQQSLGDLISAGKIDSLMSLDLSDRLPQLVSLIRGLSENHAKDLRDLSLGDFYVALPDRLSDKVTKRDFSPSYLKLFINGEAVYFDSAEERVCGYLLHKYQLVDKFVEGENLHVRANNVNRIDLDFYLEDYGVFIEYHPQSQRDRAEGRSLEEAGIRKTESIKLGGYKECWAFHISDYDGLYNVLVKELGVKLSYQQFLSDVSEAEKVGAAMNLELQLIS
jgi:hypothetical protein